MTFSSLIFLFGILPISFLLYFLIPTMAFKNIILILISLVFYAWDNPIFLILLILSILWNYIAAINIESESHEVQRKRIFIISVGVNLFILCFFKYANFLIDIINVLPLNIHHLSLSLPIGLSFFTFSAISYLADVYTKKTKAQKHLMYVALYISFFGKVTMGPIVQYAKMEEELKKRTLKKIDIQEGIFLFLKGLFKKVLLADRLSVMHTALASNGSMLGAWLFAISYMLQIYFDFSGYSDMAIGLSRCFGFHFEANFNHPYSAISIQDFWRRWHISLSQWFRDYIYIPLGGNRVSALTYCRNIFVVWFLTGLWHGANWTFIFWGLYYGCLLLLERFIIKPHLEKWPMSIKRIYTLFFVLIGWVFFMSSNIGQAFQTIGHMFGIHTSGFVNANVGFYLKTNLLLLIISIFLSGNTYKYIQRANYVFFKRKAKWVTTLVYLFLVLVSVSYIISSTFQSFLYFAF